WTSDGAGLVIAVTTVDFGWITLYYWDKASDTITPFYDFSSIESQAELESVPDGGEAAPAFYMPRTMVLLPDDTALTLHRSVDGLAVLRWMLPPDGEPQTLIPASLDNALTLRATRVAASAGGKQAL